METGKRNGIGSKRPIVVHGGGVAGCAAAIAARKAGARVTVYERSTFPRHKVCGEFLSHGVEGVFRQLGLWEQFLGLHPARMTRLELHFRSKSFSYNLPHACWGLSRYTLDEWLMEKALDAGSEWLHENAPPGTTPRILAYGRNAVATKGQRTFGFKAHHAGPATETIELHFFDGCYVGVNPVEDGLVNVCGLGPESILREHGFAYDTLCDRSTTLRARRESLTRTMDWLSVGPLVYKNRFREASQENVYPVGDALGFVDPFTGSGILNALLSGSLAGRAAANEESVHDYMKNCSRRLHRPFLVSALARKALASGVAEYAAGWVPASLLFELTRARLG
jgi:flavin-dependent dehydrogenase